MSLMSVPWSRRRKHRPRRIMPHHVEDGVVGNAVLEGHVEVVAEEVHPEVDTPMRMVNTLENIYVSVQRT
jgi:hypothetical protein